MSMRWTIANSRSIWLSVSVVLFVISMASMMCAVASDGKATELSDQSVELILIEAVDDAAGVGGVALPLFLASLIINIVTKLLKSRIFFNVLRKKVSSRYRIYIPILMGVVLAGCSYLIGMDPTKAIILAFSGPTAIVMHELVDESILGNYTRRASGGKE